MDKVHKVHVFEKAGLGIAPFRFVRLEERVFQAAPGEPYRPGSSCDYCATGIRWVCIIRDAQGKEFKVGTDCVHKTGDAGLKKRVSEAERKIRKEQAERLAKTWVEQRLAEGREALVWKHGEEWAEDFLSQVGTTYPWSLARKNISSAMADRKAAEELEGLVAQHGPILRALPHPHRMPGKSFFDYVEYVKKTAPQTALKSLKKRLGETR